MTLCSYVPPSITLLSARPIAASLSVQAAIIPHQPPSKAYHPKVIVQVKIGGQKADIHPRPWDVQNSTFVRFPCYHMLSEARELCPSSLTIKDSLHTPSDD